jgi:hypothetical protein
MSGSQGLSKTSVCGRRVAAAWFRGVDTLTALSLHLELAGDWQRFDSPRKLSSWLGLTPSLQQSGEGLTQGSITKTGSSIARRLLVEAAWHYARPLNDGKGERAPQCISSPRNTVKPPCCAAMLQLSRFKSGRPIYESRVSTRLVALPGLVVATIWRQFLAAGQLVRLEYA